MMLGVDCTLGCLYTHMYTKSYVFRLQMANLYIVYSKYTVIIIRIILASGLTLQEKINLTGVKNLNYVLLKCC